MTATPLTAYPLTAYKVLTAAEMLTLEEDKIFHGSAVDLADGYIHLSTAEQLTATVDLHFAGQDDLHIVAVDLEGIDEPIKWEEARGGTLFPHLYGDLPLDAVIAYGPMRRDEDGRVKLPVAG